jgi:hypothetical protein
MALRISPTGEPASSDTGAVRQARPRASIFFWDKSYTAITLGNRDYDAASNVIQKIRDLLTAK